MDQSVQMGAKSLYEPFHPRKFELLSGINRYALRRPLDHKCGRKLATPLMSASFNDTAISSQQANGAIMIIAA
ncbi:hypothetical protein XH88_35650 [Bradyrhizobium sp. CCBAU 51627]|nr:hypothetical protein [Bradyrhizobium sp. CCBAU 51627]